MQTCQVPGNLTGFILPVGLEMQYHGICSGRKEVPVPQVAVAGQVYLGIIAYYAEGGGGEKLL